MFHSQFTLLLDDVKIALCQSSTEGDHHEQAHRNLRESE